MSQPRWLPHIYLLRITYSDGVDGDPPHNNIALHEPSADIKYYTVVGQSNEWLRTCWPAQLVGLCVVEGRKRARIMYNQLLSCSLGHNELMIYSTNIIIIRQQNPTFLCLIWSRFCSRTATFVHSLDYYDWYRAYSVYTNSLLYV